MAGPLGKRRVGLRMYDLLEVRKATEDWWQGLRRAMAREGLKDIPESLDRESDLDAHWRSPDLLLSQTCGYPLKFGYADILRLVATPVYDCPDHEGPNYCSLVLVRAGEEGLELADFRGAVAAYNGEDSQSGYSALRALVAPLAREGKFFSETIKSGGHLFSMLAVQEGRADLCAVDSVTFRLAERHAPERVAGLRILCLTESAPALPYVTKISASDDEVARLRAALRKAVADPQLAACREALLIEDFEVMDLAVYHRMVQMEADALVMGYAKLA